MKNKDTSELANAYTLVQENWIKKAAATAAIAGTMGAAHANNPSSNDYPPQTQHPSMIQNDAPKAPEESSYRKAYVAYEYAMTQKMVDETTLKLIALDKEIAQRYALHLIQNGQRLPDTIKHAISKQFNHDLKSTISNQQD